MILQSAAPLLLTLLTVAAGVVIPDVNSYDKDYGVFIGRLLNQEKGISGLAYLVNETAIQIRNFTFDGEVPDVHFWLDEKEAPTVGGVKIPTFESGITPLGAYANAERVVLLLPSLHKIKKFRSLAIYSLSSDTSYAVVQIPSDLVIPRPQFLSSELKGSRYSLSSGPILVVDRRTVKVFGFIFDADKAPDGFFFAGKGSNVSHATGMKVPIRGRDKGDEITSMSEKFRGGRDVVLDLPADISELSWLSVYCYKFQVDFGHVDIADLDDTLPPYVPVQKRFDELESGVEGWTITSLLGTGNRRNFTFQLGPPAGKKGWMHMAHSRPAKYVWYVNGHMADLYLKRGVTYNFIVEGGNDESSYHLYNPLYISDDQFGGYGKLSEDERANVKIFAGDAVKSAGRLCAWNSDLTNDQADQLESFIDYRKSLSLKCEAEGSPAAFQFTPTSDTPDELYYQSYTNYNMGYKVHIVDELPNLPDIVEAPFEWQAYQQSQSRLTASGACSAAAAVAAALLPLLLL